jgi:hypothetical protein
LPEAGVIEINVGPFTVNVGALVVEDVPPGVVTVTDLVESVAVDVIVQVVVSDVPAGFTVMPAQVTPAPPNDTAVAPVRLLPVSVTARPVVPRLPLVGLIEVSVGAGGITVNVTALVVVPLAVLTVAFEVPGVALERLKVAVIEVELATVKLVTVTPLPTVMAVAPVKLVPVRVTANAVVP